MEKESIIEEISNYKDQRRNFLTMIILLSGGLVGLIYKVINFNFTATSVMDVLMLFITAILDYFFINTIILYNQEITKLLNKLKEVKEQ